MKDYSRILKQEKRVDLANRVQSLTANVETFDLQKLESALDHVEDAIEYLEEDEPKIGSALTEARAAKESLKNAIKAYGGIYTRRLGPKVSVDYNAVTEEFNIKHASSALDDVSDAVDALENENVSSALSSLRDAQDSLDDAIESYEDYDDDGYLIRRRLIVNPPSSGMAADSVSFDSQTVELASCRSARRRVRVARRALRRALRAYANCTGVRVIRLPQPPPSSGMAGGTVEFADAPMKTEDGKQYPKSDFAYTPSDAPSTWKLRLTSVPGGDPDTRIVGAAVAALGKGFRGNKVEIPSEDLPAVKAKVLAAWKKIHPDAKPEEVPSVLKFSTAAVELAEKPAEDEEEKSSLEDLKKQLADLVKKNGGPFKPATAEIKALRKQIADLTPEDEKDKFPFFKK